MVVHMSRFRSNGFLEFLNFPMIQYDVFTPKAQASNAHTSALAGTFSFFTKIAGAILPGFGSLLFILVETRCFTLCMVLCARRCGEGETAYDLDGLQKLNVL